ncbi:sensor histidine kinase [Luteimicrobium subarcticum]|uniref:histidine kinase n=1 Tax=Luteimicrobium subarcticum TaxID=620910 RepID=A0A2M8WTL0_9MICO|nr:sensor histidine kinase [Luteimicrobium subarcticum]PJI94275.1 signal transduction histidine kinase [Luteimicrobium subarcticum]
MSSPVTPPPTPQHVGFFRGPFARRSWTELLFLLAGIVPAALGLAWFVVVVAVGVSLAWTVVGLFVGGWLLLGTRAFGALYRLMGRAMLAVDVPPPAPFRRGTGFWGRLRALLGDVPSWRAWAFLLPSFVVSVVGLVVSVVFVAAPLGALTYGFWYRFLPLQQAADGTMHRGTQYGTDWFVDTPGRIWLQAAGGVVMLFLWPYLERAFVHLERLLIVNLLGPTRASQRVGELERSRGRAVEDADDRLRRIERDLHDGTQARLVAVAMQLGEAKEQLAPGEPVPGDALALVSQAHDATKDALVELREIARGIRPPVLDAGLAHALATLAARSPVRTVLDVEPGVSAAPAIEALAYAAASELVTNAAKHAHASTVWVLVEPAAPTRPPRPGEQPATALRLRVRDDGRGGAVVNLADAPAGRGSGLAGLVERVRAVDGTLTLVSPPGGGTRVDVVLPLAVPSGSRAATGLQAAAHATTGGDDGAGADR